MKNPHLDEKSLSALRIHRALRSACFASISIQLASNWFGHRWFPAAAEWISLGAIAALAIFCTGAVLFARRVRCPHCSNSAMFNFAPSWRQSRAQLFESKGTFQCAYCQEVIDTTGAMTTQDPIA
jgi:hypothetical protein